jgi:L-2-hydroxyglutarate oxidase LhgO
VTAEDLRSGDTHTVLARFVFIGAGGGALELLEKSEIPEGHGYSGFPVSGIWLRCDADEVSTPSPMPRSMARPPTAPRPCRCRILTPAS